MKKVEIYTHVENGKVNRNRRTIEKCIAAHEGKDITITIQRTRKRRSNNQNAYLHLLFTIFKDELNELGNEYTMLEVKAICKAKFAMIDVVNEATGEVIGQRIQDTSEMTTTELNALIENTIRWAAEYFGIIIPYPNENFTLNI